MSSAPRPKMSRFVCEQLPEELRYPFPNADGTARVDRLRSGDEYFAEDLELVDGPLFPLGQVVVTPGLLDELAEVGIDPAALGSLLERHRGGDWGELESEDLVANDIAVRSGARILSSYRIGAVRIWVITEASIDDAGDRASTCLLTPDEY